MAQGGWLIFMVRALGAILLISFGGFLVASIYATVHGAPLFLFADFFAGLGCFAALKLLTVKAKAKAPRA